MDHISSARNGGEKSIEILRGKVPAMRLYEIEERELDMLEKGMPASLFLNFGIALVHKLFIPHRSTHDTHRF